MTVSAAWQALVQCGAANRVVAALNALPLPYHRLPLRVRGERLEGAGAEPVAAGGGGDEALAEVPGVLVGEALEE